MRLLLVVLFLAVSLSVPLAQADEDGGGEGLMQLCTGAQCVPLPANGGE